MQIAMDVIDIDKDPYFMRNHLGTYECKLCLTLHNNPESYMTHTQGKKHQSNLQKRASEQAKENPVQPMLDKTKVEHKKFVKIGRPGYKVTKQRDPDTNQQSMLFQVDYPEIAEAQGVVPRHRFMSAYEQHIEPPDRHWQYLLFAAEPYETIAFKVPSREIDKDPRKLWTYWNRDAKQFYLQFAYKMDGGGVAQSMGHLREIEEQRMKAHQTQQQLQTLSEESAQISGQQQSQSATVTAMGAVVGVGAVPPLVSGPRAFIPPPPMGILTAGNPLAAFQIPRPMGF